MGILSDWQIRRDVKIEPFAEGIKREGKISYGNGSYGYDARIGYKFKVFSPIECTEIDPKNFNPKALVEVDLTPTHNHNWTDVGEFKHCQQCGAWKDTPSEKSYQCPTVKPDYILIPPHSFLLGETVETFEIPRDTLCIVIGKSTYARCGIVVNVTPLEPEWKGKVTVEISNTTPLPARIYVGEGIMQCVFLRTDGISQAVKNGLLDYLSENDGMRHMELVKALKKSTCHTSYEDKRGKYQDQTGLTLPTVDKTNQ